ncbi:MAG TPA: glucose-6-phosphate dehydrogenase [Trueperaceae bacterium]|nr:glucose-6-phosphate dehydrogenase [Trueperaceae bacterium]
MTAANDPANDNANDNADRGSQGSDAQDSDTPGYEHPGDVPSTLFVIFGATGDLAGRKLIPALYRVVRQGGLDGFHVLGAALDELDDTSFRQHVFERLNQRDVDSDRLRTWCDERLRYQTMPDSSAESFEKLAKRIQDVEKEVGLPGNRAYYLALPPGAVPDVIDGLGRQGLNEAPGFARVVIEKPFGTDLDSARALNAKVHEHFSEDQVYRIDHYLGKDTVQNLMAFRFANPIFEHVWNRDRVERVEITVAETLGVENRASYYDRAGALRDMVQNHMTQILCFAAMEAPAAFDADSIRHEKVKVLRSMRPHGVKQAVFGQYTRGDVEGSGVRGYKEEDGVPGDSPTPTYVALELRIENWRWQGVPFYLRTGKRMPKKVTEMAVVFRAPPTEFFHPLHGDTEPHGDVLRITVQPHEGFYLGFDVKQPGPAFELTKQDLQFRYAEAFDALPDAYETLLVDVVEGDQTLFVRNDEVEASWALYTPLLNDPPEVHPYPAGTWGPKAAGGILEEEEWHAGRG